MEDERELVRQAKLRSPAAWSEIYRRHYPAIYRYLVYQVGEELIAEDIASDVFLKALEAIDGFVFQGLPLVAWLFRIARNTWVDYTRKQRVREALPLEEGLLSSAAQPDEIAERTATQELIRKALQRLTVQQRQILILRFVEERTCAEIARILGRSETSVKALQRRGLASLQRLLENT